MEIVTIYTHGSVSNTLHTESEVYDNMWSYLGKPSIWDFFNQVWCMVDKLYYRAKPYSSLRPIARFVVEIQRFVCNRNTLPNNRELQSKGIAMHAYSVSAYYAWTGLQLNGPRWACSKINVKIEQGSNFIIQNDSRCSLMHAQETYLKGELTYGSSMNLAVSR